YVNGESGTYDLRLAKVPGAFVVPAGEVGRASCRDGDHTGAITLGDLDQWTFSASAGDYINLRIGTANFYATLVLYGPDGALVKSASDTGLKHDLPLAYQATNSGTFTLLVSSYVNGENGTYDLRLAKVPGAFVVPAGDEGGPMTNGANHTGAITLGRSEERRVGKECRARWGRDRERKK